MTNRRILSCTASWRTFLQWSRLTIVNEKSDPRSEDLLAVRCQPGGGTPIRNDYNLNSLRVSNPAGAYTFHHNEE